MKVAVCTDSKSEDARISDVFGRCKFFALFDKDSKDLSFIENPGFSQQRGAGVVAAQTLIDNDVSKVYCGNVGPNAEDALKSGNIRIEIVKDKTVKELVS
jgi:predicted Fe-Mo cluster-binding NifX family protein